MGSCQGEVEERGAFYFLVNKLNFCHDPYGALVCVGGIIYLFILVFVFVNSYFIIPKVILGFSLFMMEQIVTLGMRAVSPIEKVGKYVSPKEWNKLISDPDTVSNSFTF